MRETAEVEFSAASVLETQVKDELTVLLCGSRQLSEDKAMSKEEKSTAEQLADEAKRRALNPTASRQTISDSQVEPELQENHKRLRADRQAREAELRNFEDEGQGLHGSWLDHARRHATAWGGRSYAFGGSGGCLTRPTLKTNPRGSLSGPRRPALLSDCAGRSQAVWTR